MHKSTGLRTNASNKRKSLRGRLPHKGNRRVLGGPPLATVQRCPNTKYSAACRAAGQLAAALDTGGRASARVHKDGLGWRGDVDLISGGHSGVVEAAGRIADLDALTEHSSYTGRLLDVLEAHAAAHAADDAPDSVIQPLFNEVGQAVLLLSRRGKFFNWAVERLMFSGSIDPVSADNAFKSP
jgi:hypothetical protein